MRECSAAWSILFLFFVLPLIPSVGGGQTTRLPVPAIVVPSPATQPANSDEKADENSWVRIKERAGEQADRADAERNKVYKELLAVLDDDEKKKLVKAERAWIAFRDSESEFESEYTGFGTDRAVNYPAAFKRLTKQRTRDLRDILKERVEATNRQPSAPSTRQ